MNTIANVVKLMTVMVLIAMIVANCGQKGPLRLPENTLVSGFIR